MKAQSLQNYLDELAGPTATPGGGSAAAISGAMGAALVSMACNLTIGRPRYSGSEALLQTVLTITEGLRDQLLQLAQADCQAFERVMAAYRLPKATETERIDRQRKIRAALQEATQTQLRVVVACADLIRQIAVSIDKINPNTMADAAAALHLANTGLQIGRSNVYLNAALLDDLQIAKRFQHSLLSACNGVEAIYDKALAYAHQSS